MNSFHEIATFSFFHILRCIGSHPCFADIFAKGNNFCDFLFCSHGVRSYSENGSTLKGKNLLQVEQILSFKC